MKKLAITCALLSGMVVSQVWADAASDLKSRLDKVSSFHASFTQKVTDGSGNAVQDGQGDLWVKRPNLFNWHMTQPDESVLVSDGKTLWFYNPFVEQATATWLKDATSQKFGSNRALMAHGRIIHETIPPTDHMVSHDHFFTFLNGA